MRRSLLVAWFCFAASACQTGAGSGLCEGVNCKTGFTCDADYGICKQISAGAGGGASANGGGTATGGSSANGGGTSVLPDGGSGAGGGDASMCTPACTALLPFCNTDGLTPLCVQCRTGFVCSSGYGCDNGSCLPDTSGSGGGSSSGSGGGTATGPVVFDDGGMTAACLQQPGNPQTCTKECNTGFICVSGQCVLRGSDGPVQVTLRFNQPEDLDLHVVEPLPDGGSCEIWYGNTNNYGDGGLPLGIMLPFPIPEPASCGAKGWLDLDSNAACTIDNVDTENVIYSPNTVPTSGHYIVRVDYYENCMASGPVPYEVEVRANGVTEYYCGSFDPGDSNGGGANSGVTIAGFTIP